MPRTDVTITLKNRGFLQFLDNQGQVTSTQNQGYTDSRASRKIREGNWDRAKPKILAPSPYYLFHRVLTSETGTVDVWDRGGKRIRLVDHPVYAAFPPFSDFPNDSAGLFNEAMIKALQNVKDQKWNAGVAIAEAGGLAQMLVDAGSGIAKIRRDFIRGDFRSAYNRFRRKHGFQSWSAFKKHHGQSLNRAQLGSALPNTWLYYHLGIKPTVMDIHAAHKAHAETHNHAPENWEVQVKSGTAKKIHKETRGSAAAAWNMQGDVEASQVQSCRVYLHVRPTDPFMAKLSQLGVTNVPEAIWNGLPFSFVADYFVSVGDYLSVLDAGIGWQFLPYVRSERRVRHWSVVQWHDASPRGWARPYSSIRKYRCRELELNRTVVSNPYPPMFDVLPRVKLRGPGMNQVTNMLSLLTSAFGRGVSPVFRH